MSQNYGLCPVGNEAMTHLEKVVREHDARLLAALGELSGPVRRDIIAVVDDGVANFEAAGAAACPLTKVAVGLRFTANALAEWRKKGALG